MADLLLNPLVLGVTEMTIEPWAPGQSDVIAPYRPASYAAGPSATGWRGTVGIAPRRGVSPTWEAADREFGALRGRMRGRKHRVKLPLPPHFASAPPPIAATTTLTRAQLDNDGSVRLYFTADSWGNWAPTDGSYFNVGEALYLLDSFTRGSGYLKAVPSVEPLGIRRPRGIFPIPGGGAPAGVTRAEGMGQFRGSLYTADLRSGGDSDLYWVDVATGTRREVLGGLNRARSLASYGGMLIYNSAGGRDSSLRYVSIDLADPRRNREIRSINFTGLPGGTSNRVQGLAEWQGPDDDGPKLYAGIDNGLYRAVSPPPLVTESLDWNTYWERITGPTGFSGIAAMSPGPNPGDPLYILDRVLNRIYTWDGVVQREWASGTVGATAGPNIVAISDCFSIEWYRGELYAGAAQKGTTGPAIHRINWDTPADATTITWVDPYVWARLDGGPVGNVGPHVPEATFNWTEVVP